MMATLRNHFVYCTIALVFAGCGDSSGTSAETQPNTALAGQTAPTNTATSKPVPNTSAGAPASSSATTASQTVGPAAMPAAGSGASAAPTVPLAQNAGTGGAPVASASPIAGAAGSATNATNGTATGCDRVCLLDVMKGYQDALVAKDPSKLAVTADVKYSENGVVAKFGETMVWKSVMSLVPDTILNFADTTEGNVASQFVFNDSSQKIYQARLRVVDHKITEVETMIVMQGDQFYNPAGMKVEPVFMQAIDPAKRMPREALEAVTQLYLDYLEGKKSGPMVPFDAMCKRYENGTVTASGLSSFNAQSWSFDLTRRILVIDEESGITWGMFPFGQSASTLVVGEAFKIIEGKIMMIQAVMKFMPPHGVWD